MCLGLWGTIPLSPFCYCSLYRMDPRYVVHSTRGDLCRLSVEFGTLPLHVSDFYSVFCLVSVFWFCLRSGCDWVLSEFD